MCGDDEDKGPGDGCCVLIDIGLGFTKVRG
jgi:hypothetical protein